MSFLDVLAYARVALTRHGLRTVLSLVGVAIGVAAVVTLTSLGQGARLYVEGQFSFLGANLLTVLPGKVETSGAIPGIGGAPNDLTLDDALTIRRSIPEILALVPVVTGNDTLSAGARSRQTGVMGATADLREILDLQLSSGEFLPPSDFHRGAPVAVLGAKLARELFPDQPAVGQPIRVGDWRVRVIGVLRDRGRHLGIDVNEVAYVPVATSMRMFDRSSLFRILLRVRSPVDVERVKGEVLRIITERHDEEDVTCITPDAVVSSMSSILDILTLALAGIAAISLSVAGIGIMNVMLVTVSERTAEVGLLKALGARRAQILAVFLTEAAALSLAGGLVGLGASLALVAGAGVVFPEFPVQTPSWAIAAALAVSLGVGLGFGVLPARRAADLDPIAALSRK